MTEEDYSLINKKLDPTSSFWKKKYMLLLKRTENVEKQNLRLINRMYQIKKIKKRITKEREFLMNRLDGHKDDYRATKFYIDSELLSEGSSENKNAIKPQKIKQSSKEKAVQPTKQTETKKASNDHEQPPKKPLNAFLRYCQAHRQSVLDENESISDQDLTKLLSKDWNTLESSKKEVYYEMFDRDRLRYEKELEIYNKKQRDEACDSVITSSTLRKNKLQSSEENLPINDEDGVPTEFTVPTVLPKSHDSMFDVPENMKDDESEMES